MTQELVVREEHTEISLLEGDSPAARVVFAQATAQALAPVIEKHKLYAMIPSKQGPRKHVMFEGWQVLGQMLGVFPITVWTRPLSDGYEARVEARTLSGALVGAAEGQCTRSEKTWADRDDFALRSMAQTRAGSKALASCLRFIVTLAGYEGTPAEEMPRDHPQAWKPEPQGDAPNCGECNGIMEWRYGVKNGRKWQAWMCPDYKTTKHQSVFVGVVEEVPERDSESEEPYS